MNLLFQIYQRTGRSGRSIFLLSALLYILLFQRRVLLDITAQVQTLVKVCHGEVALPPTGMFYVLVWLTAFGQTNFTVLMGAAAMVLAGLALAKFWATRHIFEAYFGEKDGQKEYFGWLSLALAFVCSLPTADWWIRGWYITGQPSPNYWMNGTVLASWPFAIVLFWQSYRQLQQPEAAWLRWQLLWLVLLVFSKPSYALVLAVVYPIFLLGRQGFTKTVGWNFFLLVLFLLLLVAQYYLVFLYPESIYVKEFNRGQSSGVVLRPFAVWRLYSGNIGFPILAGVAFPLGIALAYWRELRHKLLFWYAWAGFIVALAISAVFMQTGEESYTWAFRFQHYIAAYLLFVVSVLFVWEKIRANNYRLDHISIWVVLLFLLHLVSGFIYLGKMWWTKSYY